MKTCSICDKGSHMGGTRIKLRGNYNPTNWSRKYPNLQKTKDAKGAHIVACTKCIKRMAKNAK